MRNWLKKFSKSEDGAAMVEYAVILALVLVVGSTALYAIGTDVKSVFSAVDKCLKGSC